MIFVCCSEGAIAAACSRVVLASSTPSWKVLKEGRGLWVGAEVETKGFGTGEMLAAEGFLFRGTWQSCSIIDFCCLRPREKGVLGRAVGGAVAWRGGVTGGSWELASTGDQE